MFSSEMKLNHSIRQVRTKFSTPCACEPVSGYREKLLFALSEDMNSNGTSQVARTVTLRMWGDPARNSWSYNTRGIRWLVFITVISIICPITTGLNTMIMIAVKTKHRMKTKSNIALACLSSTDAVMGVIGQPLSFISWMIAVLQETLSVRTVYEYN